MPGGLAARWMGWQRRTGAVAGPLGASGEASTGEPVTVELWIAGAWVDITSYTMVRDDTGSIRVTRGIRDEGSQTEHATAQLQLKNTDGRFSPRNPAGPHFGLIGRNTPMRISVPDGLGGKSYRLWGEVANWAQGWESSGNDVWTDVEVSGIIRRLAQGPAPERSVIYHAVTDPLLPQVVAYWPCEDPAESTQLASALVSGSPMRWSGTPTLASYDGFKASDPLPDLTLATLSGGVARYDDPTATQVRFLASIPADGLSNGKVLCSVDQFDYSPGSAQFWELYYTTDTKSLVLTQHDADGSELGAALAHTLDVRGRPLYVSIEFAENGTSLNRAVRLTDVNSAAVYSVTDTAAVTQVSRVTRVQFGPASRSVVGLGGTQYLPGVAIGHVTVENVVTATDALGVRLNPIGEKAGRRVQRLCGEDGIPVDWVGDLDDTVAMGAQGRSNPLTLMRECVEADGGMLDESRGVLGLGYRTRASLYNQDAALVLDYAGHHLAAVPTPVEDDQRTRNKVTVTANGVSATHEETEGALSTALPPAGVGAYGQDSDTALNLATTETAALRDQAAWRVHLGTVDEARHPQISVNLAHASFVANPALKRAVLALRQGDRVQIQNPPSWLPPDTIDQLILGVEETITHFEHRLTFTCAPASPFTVGFLDSSASRIDTDGSELLSAVSSGATSLVVVPSAGESTLWTTDAAEAPWDIRVGGEVMRVTAVSNWLTDTFNRSVSNGWGSADTGQAWSTGGGTAADYAVGSNVGSHTLATANASRRSFTEVVFTDFDYYVDVAASALATGGFLSGGPTGRYIDSDNLYAARLEFTTSNTLILTIRKRVGGTETALGSYTLPDTYVAGVYYRVRFQARGAALMAKAWAATDLVEMPGWQVSVTDGSISTTTYVGVRSISASGNTNVNPQIRYQNARVVSPQTFTVTRSVNGVTKSHAAGADVCLATPTILAL
ncbi:hypothetical protein [Streptomyces lasiicapitis]|uniref:hypothetical protein n=1 Tax=Streptomyces lasiicapitis TaxID=1923961 RepID=UPI00364A8525